MHFSLKTGNQTTRIRSEVPLVIGGKTLAGGDYSMFIELKEGDWTLVLSTQPCQEKYDPGDKTKTFGGYNYDPKFDVARIPMRLGDHRAVGRSVHDRLHRHDAAAGHARHVVGEPDGLGDFTVGQ